MKPSTPGDEVTSCLVCADDCSIIFPKIFYELSFTRVAGLLLLYFFISENKLLCRAQHLFFPLPGLVAVILHTHKGPGSASPLVTYSIQSYRQPLRMDSTLRLLITFICIISHSLASVTVFLGLFCCADSSRSPTAVPQ